MRIRDNTGGDEFAILSVLVVALFLCANAPDEEDLMARLVERNALITGGAMSATATSEDIAAAGRACRIHRFGPPSVMALEDVGIASPREGEALVRIAAAGVGPWDAWIRQGRSAVPQPLPLTLGSDLSGMIAAVGPGVTGFVAGDPVFGVTNKQFTGAYADYAIASALMIATAPAGLGHSEAAAVPVVATTAWQALFDEARLERGQTVLVLGAAGSVGAFAVQLGRWAGVRVVATGRAGDQTRLHSLGADQTIDLDATRFEDAVDSVDAVIDLVGGDLQARSFAVLRPGGRLVSAVSPPDQTRAADRGVVAGFFLVDVTTERLTQIGAMIAKGALRVDVGEVLPLRSASLAHEMLEGSRPRPRGKIVLRVAE